MSSPQHPTGSGPQPWQDQPPQHPGQNAPQAGAQPPTYGSGPGQASPGPGQAYGSAGPYGSGPAQCGSAPGQNAPAPGPYGSAPGPYGSAPAQYGSGPGPYGSAPGPYGSAPGQYGSAPGPYGSAPGPYGSAPGSYPSGPYGSAPGQFGQAPAPKQKTGPGLIGPLTLRDLFLLFAGLLALIALFVPFRGYSVITTTVWHWNVADMSALVFNLLSLLIVVAAVLVNKFGNGRLRVGSLSLDQLISVLTAAAFTYAFVDLLTSAVYWRVGSYLAFFAALIAFFAGVFTMLPFFAKEFDGREAIETHPKARPVSKHTPHPAPVANVPGGNAGGPGFAPYGSAPAGAGAGAGFGAGPGQPGPGQPGPGQFGQNQSSFAAPEQQAQQSEQQAQQPEPQQFGQPDEAQQPNPYAPPEQQEAEHSADTFAAPAVEAPADSADGPVHSTGDGQTYLGRRDSDAPQHSQSEPTQAFGVGQDHADVRAEEPTMVSRSAAADQQTVADRSGDMGQEWADSEQRTASGNDGGATAAVGGGVIGAGAAAAGVAVSNSDSERRRGRHAAPEAETDGANGSKSSDAGSGAAGSVPGASAAEDETPTAVSPAESSDLVSKVNSKTSDTSSQDVAEQSSHESTAHENVVVPAADDRSQSDADDESTARAERTEAPESEEPTQYVPVADYRNRPEDENSEDPASGRSDEDTVAQTAIDNEPVPAAAGSSNNRADQSDDQDGGGPIVQAFWFAVPEPREAVDPTTGLPVFTIYPGDWYLSLEDNGSWFKVRDTDGSEGLLRNIEGIQRG